MKVARVIGGAHSIQVQVEHARGMGAVHQSVDAAGVQLGHQVFQRQNETGLTGHVIKQGETCAGTCRLQDPLADFIGAFERERNLHRAHGGAGGFGHEADRVGAGVVFVVGDEQFIPGAEGERAEDYVDACGCIAHQRQVIRVAPQEVGRLGAGGIHDDFQFGGHEADRFSLQALAPALLSRQYRAWAGTERTVIQEGDGGIQQPGCGRIVHQRLTMKKKTAAYVARSSSPSTRTRGVLTA